MKGFAPRRVLKHPASRAFSYGTYALYREKALHESCQVLVEHAQRVAKILFRTQAGSPGNVNRGQKRVVVKKVGVCILPLATFGSQIPVKVKYEELR